MLKAGIVGLGKMGMIRKSVLDEAKGVEVVALCDPTLAQEPVDAEEVLQTSRYEDLLKADLDVLFVCTPNNMTAEITVAALENGLHVFCEKPPGRNLQDLRAIMEAASRHPAKKIKVGFNHRYHDSVIQAHRLVASGRLGEVLWLRGVYGKSGGQGFADNWRSKREISGGGILLDQGIHMLDLFRLFAGEFSDVRSMITTSFWPIEMEDNAFALLRTKDNVVASLQSSSTHWKHTFLLDICLTEGHLSLQGILSSTRSYGTEMLVISRRQFEDEAYAMGNPRQEVVYFDTDRSWEREIEEFLTCIRRDAKVEVGTIQDAWKTMELVYRIYAADDEWRHAAAATAELRSAQEASPEMKEAL